MKAVVVAALGEPEGLQLRGDWADPSPEPDQVVIEVETAGVNFADVNARRGRYPHRLPALPFVPGLEVAGVIAEVGSQVTNLSVGQRVAAFPEGGSYAQRVLARAALTYLIPDDMDWVQAGGLLIISQTAFHLLRTAGHLRRGESVLVHAAAGGVGSMLVQLARVFGAGRIIGTVGSDEKIQYAVESGADEVINYRSGDFGQRVLELTEGRGADLVLDAVGGATRVRSLEVLAPLGRLVMYGNASAESELAVSTTQLRERATGAIGFNLTMLRRSAPELLRESMNEILDLMRSGRLRVDVTEVFPLANAADAHRHLEQRASRGKLVLQVGGRG